MIAPQIITDNADAALQMALDAGGIVRLADMLVGSHVREGRLVSLLTDVHHVEALPLNALYLAGRHRLPKVRVFLDFLVERFGSAPWKCQINKTSLSSQKIDKRL